MNKIFNVNLGGYPFTIDENAYHKLNKYLDTIAVHFADSEGCQDILEDIEARMAELFYEKTKSKSIISIKDLEDVITIMGTPEDFGAEPIDDVEDSFKHSQTEEYSEDNSRIRIGKRLFRDGEDRIIGGVCSGLATYIGIQDPVWVRLAWIILFVTGVTPLLYLLLWILVPEAKTAGDRLAMKGKPANISNIAKTVEEELKNISDTLNDFAKDFGSKKKALDVPTFRQSKALRKGFLY